MKKGLLKGIRILDFSRILVGAYCSMMLADLGAEVIKIEPPGGDETRKWGPPFRNSDSLYYLSINRNKKSICMDLKKKEASEIALSLIEKSDIIIENFTFGKMKEFGLDYEAAKGKNEKIIYSSINSYGNLGPMRTSPSFDLIIQSYVGVMNVTGGEETEPYKVGYPVCDIMSGSHLYGAILAGILHKQMTGEGQYINTSLLETNLFAMPTINSNFLNAEINSKRIGNDHPTISPYTVFKLKNGEYFSIGVATDLQFKKLWCALNLDNFSNFKEFETNKLRIENRYKLKEIIQAAINELSEIKLFNLLDTNKLPYSKINSTKDIFSNNEQIESLKMVHEIETEDYGNMKYVRNPITYSKLKLEEMTSPPKLGSDNEHILMDLLKFEKSQIDKLYMDKIIF